MPPRRSSPAAGGETAGRAGVRERAAAVTPGTGRAGPGGGGSRLLSPPGTSRCARRELMGVRSRPTAVRHRRAVQRRAAGSGGEGEKSEALSCGEKVVFQ